MKLQADRMEGQNSITRHGADGAVINGREYTHSIIVPWKGTVREWTVRSFAALDESHFAELAGLGAELVIFGSGSRLRFVKPGLLRALIDLRIGVETMDSAAACRTYNVLLAEGRAVVAALLFEGAATETQV